MEQNKNVNEKTKVNNQREIHPIVPGSRRHRKNEKKNKDNNSDEVLNKEKNRFGKPKKEDVFDQDKLLENKDKNENYVMLQKKSEKFENYYKVIIHF